MFDKDLFDFLGVNKPEAEGCLHTFVFDYNQGKAYLRCTKCGFVQPLNIP